MATQSGSFPAASSLVQQQAIGVQQSSSGAAQKDRLVGQLTDKMKELLRTYNKEMLEECERLCDMQEKAQAAFAAVEQGLTDMKAEKVGKSESAFVCSQSVLPFDCLLVGLLFQLKSRPDDGGCEICVCVMC